MGSLLRSRLAALSSLKVEIDKLRTAESISQIVRLQPNNPWLDTPNLTHALACLSQWLEEKTLTNWCARYTLNEAPQPKRIGIVSAGNVPFVGIQDLLAVLVAGHHAYLRPSSRDQALWQWLHELTKVHAPQLASHWTIVDRLKSLDALLAMGNDETLRQLNLYVGRLVPCLLRGHCISCAWLNGKEPQEAFDLLFDDAFIYFGLGCRSLSLLYVPDGYDFSPLLEAWQERGKTLLAHARYQSHYIYQRALQGLSSPKEASIDAGFVLLKEAERFDSPPIGTLNYSYQHNESLAQRLIPHQKKLQSVYAWQPSAEVVGRLKEEGLRMVPLGEGQRPPLDAYPNGLDTMHFLTKI